MCSSGPLQSSSLYCQLQSSSLYCQLQSSSLFCQLQSSSIVLCAPYWQLQSSSLVLCAPYCQLQSSSICIASSSLYCQLQSSSLYQYCQLQSSSLFCQLQSSSLYCQLQSSSLVLCAPFCQLQSSSLFCQLQSSSLVLCAPLQSSSLVLCAPYCQFQSSSLFCQLQSSSLVLCAPVAQYHSQLLVVVVSYIAHSYTKRKNVFRLKTYNGSEYLLQADDQMDMLVWIRHISANNNPDLDSQELTESGPTLGSNTSPTPAHKITKKLSVIKQKMPQSPSIKRRKTDTGKPKTWKGKLGKSIKKHMGSSSSTGQIAVVPETGGMFGVPLEDCLPSPNNEVTNNEIAEARGLEMTGVYRIPGNKAAVTILQEEFNKVRMT
ncbi:hypothetical protein DPMN_120587 [Dreissena polymorpha]|uniref:Rho-GAP domain-containing protein n=1 Tax=Dreissena polymorpha TaxID=45954 RepID=A0A9D4GKS0_DREPO|nr:hypothetical protein DPMN_120587 [Dreissena polymorpha]